MKVCRFEKYEKDFYGVLDGDDISVIAGKPYEKIALTGEHVNLGDVRLLAPTVPKSIVAVGLN